VLATALFSECVGARAADDVPVTGRGDPGLRPFDELMTDFVRENRIPGAALAVSYHGRLVYARGFGYADVARKQPVQPGSLFRIASVSKPLTAVAVLQLVGKKKLRLDGRVLDSVRFRPYLEPGKKPDPRWKDITILQLLQHTAGFDREASFDPMVRNVPIAKAMGLPPPANQTAIIRYMLGRPLDFTPGERHAYSNFGYSLLGRAIEAASGQPYDAYVRENVLKPLGVKAPRIGRPRAAPGEVVYYDPKGRPGRVPLPYGAISLEAMDSHGGWIASASDLVRFASAFDDPERCKLLAAPEIAALFARPPGAAGLGKDGNPSRVYYACGWNVRPMGKAGQMNTWHIGYLEGSESLLVRRHDGIDWAVVFNTSGESPEKGFATKIDGRLHEAADAVRTWPPGDLFPVPTPR
jgi:CubicO group peptidase (beta-lactamase class C family)